MRPIAGLVDELLLRITTRPLEGLPSWRPGTREHDRRLAWIVLVDGASFQVRFGGNRLS